MASDFGAEVFADVPFVDSVGWKPTRASGFVALLTEAYPKMTLADVAAFAMANDIPNWEFTTDTADTQLIPTSGNTVYFLEKYPLPSNWLDLFTRWKGGETIGSVPADVPVIAPTVTQAVNQAVETVAVAEPAATSPVTQPQTIDTTAQVITDTAPNPVNISTDQTQPGQVPAAPESGKTMWIILGIVAAIIVAMSMKKKGKRKKR